MLEKRTIDPWTWHEPSGYAQAVEVRNATRTLYLAGQTAISADGVPSEGDMTAQLALALDNLETVLREAGYALADMVRMTVYTTDTEACLAAWGEMVGRFHAQGCRPSASLIGVSYLAFPSLKVEIEGIAVQ